MRSSFLMAMVSWLTVCKSPTRYWLARYLPIQFCDNFCSFVLFCFLCLTGFREQAYYTNPRPCSPRLHFLVLDPSQSIFTPYFAHVLTDCCDDMEAASLLATTTTDTSSSSSSSAKRKREAKDEARRKRRKKGNAARDGGATAMSEDEEDMDGAADVTTAVEVRWRRDAAARLVLSALRSCFSSDRSGFVDKTRFEVVMPAVVSQLECGATFPVDASSCEEGADEVASCRRHAEELVGPCLSQLAAASGKDVLWKSLASAVLLRTRSKRAGVRVAALISLRQCFEVVGEEFLSLLPECLPFLSELLEVRQAFVTQILYFFRLARALLGVNVAIISHVAGGSFRLV